MSDSDFNDISASGESGLLVIGGTPNPTATRSTATPTETATPSAVPSATSTGGIAGTSTETPTVTPIVPSPTPTATPTPASLCPQAPLSGCRTAGVSSFLIRNEHGRFRKLLVWNWTHGAATAPAEFGSPIAGTRYALCVYDAGGQRMAIEVPQGLTCGARDRWRPIPRRGYRYRDRSAASDATSRVLLRGGDASKAKIMFKSGGQNMPNPMLPYDPPVRVQLVRDDSPLCWEAEFGVLDFLQNGSARFRARHRD